MTVQISIAGDSNGIGGHMYIGIPVGDTIVYYGLYPDFMNWPPTWESFDGQGEIKVDNWRQYQAENSSAITDFNVTFSISAEQLKALTAYINASVDNTPAWDFNDFNCVDWVHEALVNSGIRDDGLTDLIEEGILTINDLSNAARAGHYAAHKYGSEGNPPANPDGSPTDYDSGYVLPTGLTIDDDPWIDDDDTDDEDVNASVEESAEEMDDSQTATSPLVLDLNGDGIQLISRADADVYFDIDGDQFAEKVGWVAGSDGLLAIDENTNGKIDDVSELFGEDGGTTAWQKLAALDTNSDGKIASADTSFGDLRIWQDADEDGLTDSGELKTLGDLDITEIYLQENSNTQTSAGQQIIGFSHFVRSDSSTGAVGDAFFDTDQVNAWYIGDGTPESLEVSAGATLLPFSRGYGVLPSWHYAMSQNETLFGLMKDAVDLPVAQLAEIDDHVSAVLFEWAGATAVDPTSFSPYFDARALQVLEKMTDRPYTNTTDFFNVPAALTHLYQAWYSFYGEMKDRILVQGTLKELFPNAGYDFADDVLNLGDDLETILDNAQELAPADPVQARAFWSNVAGILVNHAADFSLTEAQVRTEIESASGGIDILPYVRAFLNSADNTFSGTDWSEYVQGSAGNDTLTGGAGDDAFDGGAGTDLLVGGIGNDFYLWGTGSGNDTISESTGTDKILLGSGLSIDDLSLTRTNNVDLKVTINATGESLTILNQYAATPLPVESLVFADGTAIDLLGGLPIRGGSGNDTLVGTTNADTLDGRGANDTLTGDAGSDTYFWGIGGGNDTIDDVSGTADKVVLGAGLTIDDLSITRSGNHLILTIVATGETLTILDQYATTPHVIETIQFASGVQLDLTQGVPILGDNNANTLSGTSGADIFDGKGGNDTLTGGAGSDTYIWGSGSGNDTITDSAGTLDRILLKSGITLNDLSVTRTNNVDLKLTLNATGETLTVLNQYAVTPLIVERLDFSDGTQLDLTQGLPVRGGSGNDTLTGTAYDDDFDGRGGNDTLTGGAGSDVYHWGEGSGNDYVSDASGSNDQVVLGEGLTLDDLTITKSSNDLVIANMATGETLTIGNQFAVTPYTIEKLVFDDDSEIDLTTGFPVLGNGSANTLAGYNGNDTLDGRGGNDTLSGGGGNDTYLWGSGSGNDYIIDSSGAADQILFREGVTLDDLMINRSGTDLVITHIGTGETLTVGSQFAVTPLTVEKLVFDNETEFDLTQGIPVRGNSSGNTLYGHTGNDDMDGRDGNDILYANNGNDMLKGGAGNDTLNGEAGNDTLIGGAGIDTLTGGAGADIFQYHLASDSGVGSGNRDIITDFSQANSDVIDMSALDGTFTFIGTNGFSGSGNEISYIQSGGNTVVKVAIDANTVADMEFQLTGLITLTQSDFLL